MRKKLAATVCVFAGVIISASLLIVSVLAATSASATITASVSYTPAIQAKVWLHDGGTYTNGTGSDAEKGMLIFNNVDNNALYTGVSFSGGTINMPHGYKAVNGTTFKITVDNHSTNEQAIFFGLNVSASNTDFPDTELVTFEDSDPYKVLSETEIIGTITYKHNDSTITSGDSQSISFTPEIVIPVELAFNIALFTEKASNT